MKYSAKAGNGSGSFQKTFVDVTKMIGDFKDDNGVKDVWRTAIMKFYSKNFGWSRLLAACSRSFWIAHAGYDFQFL